MSLNARKSIVVITCVTTLAAIAGSLAVAQPEKPAKPPQPTPEFPLPPGWTQADVEACVSAGTPGKMHEHLLKYVGVWHGKTQMWISPGSEPAKGECTWNVTSVMDGRYVQCSMAGELPGMGPFTGLGHTGFDNVSEKFVGSWLDNHSTGIMNGVGELSKDGKTMAWTYTYNCPIRKKAAIVRQVDRFTGDGTMTFEMFTTDPKSGKEYRCMQIDLARKS